MFFVESRRIIFYISLTLIILKNASLSNIVWLNENDTRSLIYSVNNKYKKLQLHENYKYIINIFIRWA